MRTSIKRRKRRAETGWPVEGNEQFGLRRDGAETPAGEGLYGNGAALQRRHTRNYDHNPIHHIDNRLKSIASIVEKLRRKGAAVSIQNAKAYLTDIAGVRVVCNYIDDIYRIADMLCAQDDIVVLRRTDYIENPKENGYRSLHLVLSVPVFLSSGSVPVPVEVQIRTIAMDFWASLEHQIRYKPDEAIHNDDALRRELKQCAEESALLDRRMQEIYRRLKEGQKEG